MNRRSTDRGGERGRPSAPSVRAFLLCGPASAAPACLCLVLTLFASCVYDLDVPLRNDSPEFVDAAAVSDTIFYPDSSVCTLTVRDLSDARLSFMCLGADTADSSLAPCGDTLQWPGVFSCMNPDLGDKRFELSVPGNVLGCWDGYALAMDPGGSADTLAFHVSKVLRDGFDAFPPNADRWNAYAPDDTVHVAENISDGKLVFTFPAGTPDSLTPAAAGIRTRFRMAGDFRVSVDFRLRDDMNDGFETAFFASTSPDTSEYAGRVFGMYLEAGSGWVNVKCRSTNLQTSLGEITYYSGRLTIGRTDSTVFFGCASGDLRIRSVELPQLTFSAGDSVYIHLRMRVTDQVKSRHCEWDDLMVEAGEVVF